MMKLHLKRPLIVFDLETTGTSVQSDRIVELCYIKVFPDGREVTKTIRLNPGISIPAEASAVHGIYDEDIKNAPTFKQVAKELAEEFKGCDFAGFNSNRFDFPLLVEEFLRAGVEFDAENRKFVDAQRIYHMMEQRTLAAAYKFYCNKDLVNAHSAEADTIATLEVLKAQIERYDQLQNDIDFIHNFTKQDRNVDLAGRLVYNNDNQVVINFGKHKGRLVYDVFKSEPSYYEWMMNGDFPEDTKRRLTKLRLNLMKP
jgi:DNA polymerase-3 subunit epsilon